MKNKAKKLKIVAVFLSLLFITAVQTNAQSNIFSMPSTEILAKGKIGLRMSSKFKFNDQSAKKRFSSFTPRVIYGLSNNVEVGFNFGGNTQPGPDASTLIFTAKWRFYQNEKQHVSVVAGNSFHVPVRNKKYSAGTYSYVAASKSFKTGTKITAGSYFYSANVVAKDANRAGGQFAVEHKLTNKLGVAAEYYTGKHSGGNLTAGFKMKLNKRMTSNIGYTVMNQKAAQGNHFFYASTGFNF